MLKNLALGAVSVILALLAVEAGLRVFSPDKGGEFIAISFSKDFVKNDKVTGLAGVPYAEGVCHNCETKVDYKLNSLGFRDIEHPVDKAPGKYRIMVLGDSFAWGVGVDRDAVFTRLLGEKDKPLEVINASVPGWSTDSEYFYLENMGLKYKPDIAVVIFFVGNDAIGNGNYERSGFGNYQSPSPEKKDARFLSPKYIRDHSRIYRLWKRTRRELKVRLGLTPILTEYEDGSFDWKATEKWIDKFNGLADKNKFELLFVIAPDKNQFFLAKDPDRPQRLLRKYLDLRNINHLDLYPVFLDYKRRHERDWGYFKYDGHWNESGHRIVAESLYDIIRNNY